jgi:hypothetical protein
MEPDCLWTQVPNADAIDKRRNDFMRFPLVICSKGSLIIASANFFDGIGRLDAANNVLEINVARDGEAGFAWMLDADGIFYKLSSTGLMQITFLQRLGVQRRRAQYQIEPGRKVSVAEIQLLTVGLRDQFEEAPNVSDLNRQLQTYEPAHLWDAEDMRQYLGA